MSLPPFDGPIDGSFVTRILDVLFPDGPYHHAVDCTDHDHCITCVLCEDVWLNPDPAFHERVHPYVVHWLKRRAAERN